MGVHSILFLALSAVLPPGRMNICCCMNMYMPALCAMCVAWLPALLLSTICLMCFHSVYAALTAVCRLTSCLLLRMGGDFSGTLFWVACGACVTILTSVSVVSISLPPHFTCYYSIHSRYLPLKYPFSFCPRLPACCMDRQACTFSLPS